MSIDIPAAKYILFYLADSRRTDLVRMLHDRRHIDADLIER